MNPRRAGGRPLKGTEEAPPEPVGQPGAADPTESPQAETPGRADGADRPSAEIDPQAEIDPEAEIDPQSESEDPIDALRRERDAYLDLAQRTQAEFENYRKRVARETAGALIRGKGELALAMLPAIDNLERALLAAAGADGQQAAADRLPDSANDGGATDAALNRGVALVYEDLRSRLERAGVEPFDPTGDVFDPATCEAIATHPEAKVKPGVVLETVERGWRLDGQVLRPARVVVSE